MSPQSELAPPPRPVSAQTRDKSLALNTEVVKYQLFHRGPKGLGNPPSHPISSSALMPVLPTPTGAATWLYQTLPHPGHGWDLP